METTKREEKNIVMLLADIPVEITKGNYGYFQRLNTSSRFGDQPKTYNKTLCYDSDCDTWCHGCDGHP